MHVGYRISKVTCAGKRGQENREIQKQHFVQRQTENMGNTLNNVSI